MSHSIVDSQGNKLLLRTPAGESGVTARRGARLPAKWCMVAAAVVHTTAMQGCFTP